MQKTAIITDKNIPLSSALSAAARKSGRNLIITADPQNEPDGKTKDQSAAAEKKSAKQRKGLTELCWNRGSPAGARGVLMAAERICGVIDETFIVFDADFYADRFQEITPAGCSKAIDSLMAGYLYLVCELLQRFKKQKSGLIVFILKSAKQPVPNIPLSMAKNAFIGLAEETALVAPSIPCSIHLIDAGYGDLEETSAWILNRVDTAQKTSQKWVRALSKPGFFPPFNNARILWRRFL